MPKHSLRLPHLHVSCFTFSSEEYYAYINQGRCQVILEGVEATVIEGNITEQVITLERIFP